MKSNVIGSIIGGVLLVGALSAVGYVYVQNNSPEEDLVSEEMNTVPAPLVTDEPSEQESTPPATSVEDEDTVTISLAEVEQNNNPDSCWTVIEGQVYDITSFIARHPGGAGAISSICGRDGTTEFQGQASHSSSATQQLESLYIGVLE